MTQTAYQLHNEDGTSDRYIVQSDVTGAIHKVVKTSFYECVPGTWVPAKKLDGYLVANSRSSSDTEMLLHSRIRRRLIKEYGARLEFDATRSTIF